MLSSAGRWVSPKPGFSGLLDLTGIDLAPHINESMLELLPPDDQFREVFEPVGALAGVIAGMVEEGYTGRKGKGGFYRLNRRNGSRVKEARDLKTGEYRLADKPRFESVEAAKRGGLRALVEHPDKGGQYAWRVLRHVLRYAASLVPEISDNIVSVDRAMRTRLRLEAGDRSSRSMRSVPHGSLNGSQPTACRVPEFLEIAGDRSLYREDGASAQHLGTDGDYHNIEVREGAWLLADRKRAQEAIAKNGSASLWDIGDGVACLEFHSKMNSIDGDTISMIREATKIDKRGFKALVIGNDAQNSSVGANIGLALFAANTAMWPLLEQSVRGGQEALLALKYTSFPVVGAPAGMALGGGCEVLLHCDAIQAHAESYIGLVEFGVGLIPGWGGTKEMVMRNYLAPGRPGGPMPPVAAAFETISLAKVATSAAEGRRLRFLRESDDITMNRARVLADAKARALELAADYAPPEPAEVALPGPTGRIALEMSVDGFVKSGKATAHDGVVARALARVVSGGETDMTEAVSEKDLMGLEREAFLELIRTPATLDRMAHMLETGKPLRN